MLLFSISHIFRCKLPWSWSHRGHSILAIKLTSNGFILHSHYTGSIRILWKLFWNIVPANPHLSQWPQLHRDNFNPIRTFLTFACIIYANPSRSSNTSQISCIILLVPGGPRLWMVTWVACTSAALAKLRTVWYVGLRTLKNLVDRLEFWFSIWLWRTPERQVHDHQLAVAQRFYVVCWMSFPRTRSRSWINTLIDNYRAFHR